MSQREIFSHFYKCLDIHVFINGFVDFTKSKQKKYPMAVAFSPVHGVPKDVQVFIVDQPLNYQLRSKKAGELTAAFIDQFNTE